MNTHEVFNQVPPLVGHDTAADAALLEGLEREGAGWAADEIHELGRLAGSAEAQDLGRLAERVPPRLLTHDRYGHRVDEVEYVPAYHQLMETAVGHGLHAAPVGRRPAGRPRRAGREVHGLVGRRRARLPDLDDLRRRTRAARQPRAAPRSSSRCSPTASTTPACAIPSPSAA